jgi:branched-chain amino acid transport system permease protein
MTFGSQVLVMVMFALSLDLILGYAGIVTLGHAAFFGIGAYTVGLAAARLGWSEPISGLSRPRSRPALSASPPAGFCCAIAALRC